MLAKLSCKNACENLDAIVHDLQYALCCQYCSWASSHRGHQYVCAFHIYTLL